MREVFKQLLTKKNLIGCEIGVQNGENAQELLNNLSINTIYLVDQWKAYTEVNQEEKDMGYTNQKIVNRWKYSTINRFDKNKQVVIIIGNSDKTSYLFNTEILDFVYIDANHRFKNVYEDLVNWYPSLKRGGLFCGHDITHKYFGEDIQKALDMFINNYNINTNINYIQDDWYFIKK